MLTTMWRWWRGSRRIVARQWQPKDSSGTIVRRLVDEPKDSSAKDDGAIIVERRPQDSSGSAGIGG